MLALLPHCFQNDLIHAKLNLEEFVENENSISGNQFSNFHPPLLGGNETICVVFLLKVNIENSHFCGLNITPLSGEMQGNIGLDN